MKINCGPSPEAKRAAKEAAEQAETLRQREWHDFFTWKPLRLGENDCRWLETIERRSVFVEHIPAGPRYVFLPLAGIQKMNFPARDVYDWVYRSKE